MTAHPAAVIMAAILGGHSLLVIRMIEQLRQRGMRVDVTEVFTSPTLSTLAARAGIDRPQGPDTVTSRSQIRAGCQLITPDMLALTRLTQQQIDMVVSGVAGGVSNIQDIYPLSPLQQGILFHHVMTCDRAGDAYLLRSVLAFDSFDLLQNFLLALRTVIDRHDILRSAIHWEGLSEPVQVVHRQAALMVEEHELTGDALGKLLARTDPRSVRMDSAAHSTLHLDVRTGFG